MPHLSGIDIAQKCKISNIKTKLVLITLHTEVELYQKAKELNIFGYILKEFPLEEIEICIEKVLDGKSFFSPKIKESIVTTKVENSDKLNSLTPSETKH